MPKKEYTEKQKEWAARWDAANLDRMSLAVPRGYKDALRKRASETGETVNGLLRRLIEAELKQA